LTAEVLAAAAIIPKGGVLSVDEGARLAQLEREIKTGISTFIKVGRALAEIRDARLYRATHGTFEAYCRERWNLSRPRAYELMQAAAVAKSLPLSATADTTERALRPLAKLEPVARRETWAKAKKAAGDEPVTSKHVEAAMPRKAEPQEAPEPEAKKAPLAEDVAVCWRELQEWEGRHRKTLGRLRMKGVTGDFLADFRRIVRSFGPLRPAGGRAS